MSSFNVLARTVTIAPHDNADALEIAKIDGTDFTAVVRKGEYQTGDKVVYIPTQAVVPQPILEQMGLWGKERKGRTIGALAGPDGDRVKAIRLRGVLSEGLCYQPDGVQLNEGEDYGEQLGIVKWVPPLPAGSEAELISAPDLRTYTDIENIKYFTDVLKEGEEVVATEKIHGSCTLLALIDGEFFVSSKGRAGKGIALKREEDAHGRVSNWYWRAAEQNGIESLLRDIAAETGAREITLFGETFGSIVQDLSYGIDGDLAFRAFDLRLDGRYVDYDRFEQIVGVFCGLDICPVLYRGPFSREAVEAVAAGKETITGTESHVREGVIVRPVAERHDPLLGRVILKVINPDYLDRKGGTEYE